MNRLYKVGLGLLVAGVGIAVLVIPDVAADYNSTTGALIRPLTRQLAYIAIPIAILVEGLLIYFAYEYRDNDEPQPTQENRRLEIGWTVGTALILLLVGLLSYGVMAQPAVEAGPSAGQDKPADAVTVTITGHQWYWSVEYHDANVSLSQTETIALPVDRPLYIRVTSSDVIHSVHVPELGWKQDALPGRTSLLRTEITNEGEYQLYCAEFCGVAHSEMTAKVDAMSYDEYQDWLDEQKEGGSA